MNNDEQIVQKLREETAARNAKAKKLFEIIDNDEIKNESLGNFTQRLNAIFTEYLILQDENLRSKSKLNLDKLTAINNALQNLAGWYETINSSVGEYYENNPFQIGNHQFQSNTDELVVFFRSLEKINTGYINSVSFQKKEKKAYLRELESKDHVKLKNNLSSLFISFYSTDDIFDQTPKATYSNIFLDAMEDFITTFFELFLGLTYQRTDKFKNESYRSATRKFIINYLKANPPK